MPSASEALELLRSLETELRRKLEELRSQLEREPIAQLTAALLELYGAEEVSRLPATSAALVDYAILDTHVHLQQRRRAALLNGDLTNDELATYEDQMRSAVDSLPLVLIRKPGELIRFPRNRR